MVKRIDKLTDAQRARCDEWADRWIEIGLRTGAADRPRFESACEEVYGFAGLEWHGHVVWVSSPLVLAFAAPIAAYLLEFSQHSQSASQRNPANGSVFDSVPQDMNDAVRAAVVAAIGADIVDATHMVASAAEARETVRRSWHQLLGGQLWAGGWGWGGAWVSYFREVAELELEGDLWDRAKAYEATMESACWWWPHRQFTMVCERPVEIHREQVGPRGWGSHRLHRDDGPAVFWPDGWGVYALHGVRVPADLIEEGWDASRILSEPNQEVRRVAIDQLGWDNFVAEAKLKLVHEDDDPANPGRRLSLYDVPDAIYGEPVRVLLCTNGSPERDGTVRRFGLTVPANIGDAVTAAGWTYDLSRDQYAGLQRRT